MGIRVITIIVWLMVILNIFLICIPNISARQVMPTYDIIWNVNNETMEVDVSPGGNNSFSMLSLASAEFNEYDEIHRIEFSISASSEQGWPITIEPKKFNLTLEHDLQYFFINCTVPNNLSFYTTDTIQLTGFIIIYPGKIKGVINPVSATIKVKQYYNLSVEVQDLFINIKQRETAVYNINITNNGNARDTIKILIKNIDKLVAAGLDVDYQDNITIDANETSLGELKVITSKETKPGTYQIELSVKSTQEERNEGSTVPQNFTFRLEIEFNIDNPMNEDNNMNKSLVLEVEPDHRNLLLYSSIIIIFLILVPLVIWRIRKRKKIL